MNTVEVRDGQLLLRTPYSPAIVAAIKTKIPATGRRWEPAERAWLIDPAYGSEVEAIAGVPVPTVAPACNPVTTVIDLRYLGRLKRRDDDSESAYGWTSGGWNAIFPKAPLYAWFGVTDRPGESGTLYARLGVGTNTPGAEIKKAFKRLARQWHPDVCREPDAAGQFAAIREAYDLLSDPAMRARYDAGLQFEAMARQAGAIEARGHGWTPPLRCGYVLASARQTLGRLVVDQILAWEDITDAAGRVLVTSWPAGADNFEEQWI